MEPPFLKTRELTRAEKAIRGVIALLEKLEWRISDREWKKRENG